MCCCKKLTAVQVALDRHYSTVGGMMLALHKKACNTAASRIWIWLGLIVGSFTGLTRIAVGAHFLSDVVFSFFAVYLVAALVTYGAIRIAELRKASSA